MTYIGIYIKIIQKLAYFFYEIKIIFLKIDENYPVWIDSTIIGT